MLDKNADEAEVKEMIARMRDELNALVEELGLDHQKVLELSKKLDQLILELT